MERKIKFRGQTRRKGEKVRMDGTPVDGNWVCGGIFLGIGDFSIIYTYEPVEKKTVYTDTVGQYTGIQDKNDKEIYEGDICLISSSNIDAEDGVFIVKWDNDAAMFILEGDGLTINFENIYGYEVEVIGNKHDNPELLE